jgi:ATP-dependent Clp protease protease subunit
MVAVINKIREIVKTIMAEEKEQINDNVVILNAADAGLAPEPELRVIGLFCDVVDEKVAELVHALLFLNETNTGREEDERQAIDFYICTYGGNADDMFALYDTMRQVREQTDICTIGMGKVMSAGVLLLAAGTKGKRKIGKNCRIMIHSVIAGNHGSLHNLVNEMEAVEHLQQMYIDCLVKETDMSKKQLKKLLERKVNVYLSAEEAVELGIADIII